MGGLSLYQVFNKIQNALYVYVPNTGQVEFQSKFSVALSQLAADLIYLGGDSNLVSDPVVDRSGRLLVSDGALSTVLSCRALWL